MKIIWLLINQKKLKFVCNSSLERGWSVVGVEYDERQCSRLLDQVAAACQRAESSNCVHDLAERDRFVWSLGQITSKIFRFLGHGFLWNWPIYFDFSPSRWIWQFILSLRISLWATHTLWLASTTEPGSTRCQMKVRTFNMFKWEFLFFVNMIRRFVTDVSNNNASSNILHNFTTKLSKLTVYCCLFFLAVLVFLFFHWIFIRLHVYFLNLWCIKIIFVSKIGFFFNLMFKNSIY